MQNDQCKLQKAKVSSDFSRFILTFAFCIGHFALPGKTAAKSVHKF